MTTYLPTSLLLSDGKEHPIRWDFRSVLDLFEAMNDPNASDRERGYYLLVILYEDYEEIPEELWEDAVDKGLWFLNGGDAAVQEKGPRLMDWKQDFPIIIPSINRVAGTEVRLMKDLHWWTFLGYYMEIGGDCTFAQVVHIRDKLARGKRLDKQERDYYVKNRKMIDLEKPMTEDEEAFIKSIVKKRG